jgi:diacylglycerol kinase
MNKFIKGFGYAFAGIWQLIQHGRNFRVQLLALICVISAGIYFHITSEEWCAILGVSALVLSLEAINTSIEKLCDLYTTEQHPTIKTIKDIAAGAVLISALFALVIAFIIFTKYILTFTK